MGRQEHGTCTQKSFIYKYYMYTFWYMFTHHFQNMIWRVLCPYSESNNCHILTPLGAGMIWVYQSSPQITELKWIFRRIGSWTTKNIINTWHPHPPWYPGAPKMLSRCCRKKFILEISKGHMEFWPLCTSHDLVTYGPFSFDLLFSGAVTPWHLHLQMWTNQVGLQPGLKPRFGSLGLPIRIGTMLGRLCLQVVDACCFAVDAMDCGVEYTSHHFPISFPNWLKSNQHIPISCMA